MVLPFSLASGGWTTHAFEARYRPEGNVRPQLRRFRAWPVEEAQITAQWLEGLAGRPDLSEAPVA